MNPLFNYHKSGYNLRCPICNHVFSCSAYLKTVIKDEKVLWLANMITHYRHEHITSWNKCWGYNGRYYRSGWFGDYESEKMMVNERAKRQIVRKANQFLIDNKIELEHFRQLQNTSEETIRLVEKILK